MVFDPSSAFLRYVRLGDREILRGVFGAVRNRNWDTVAPDVRDVRVDEAHDRFMLTFEAICCDDDVDFVWRGEVTGAADGAVTYMFDGEARAAFSKNRIGLCALHPIRECAGRPCRVDHVDGSVTEGVFPHLVSPHQPFRSVRSITHAVDAGVRATVTFAGDVFEMEDQRNWTDASFKTYSTPLHLPFPVRLEAGARVRQAVRLQLEGTVPRAMAPAVASRGAHVRVKWLGSRSRPRIGFQMAGDPGDAAQASLAMLRPDHIRADLPLSSPGWRERLHAASRVALRAGAHVHAALFLSDAGERELAEVRAEVDAHGMPIGLWLVFHAAEKATGPRWIALAHRVLGDATPLAAGTNAYFAELNRNRPPAGSPILPCFSINPQVHAFDDRSIVETLEAQRSTVETARSFSVRPVVISPVTLRPRFNPNATDADAGRPPEADLRQRTAFGAAWTLGTLARLAASPDVHSLTFFEIAGPRGVMDEDGRLFPVGHVFAAIAGWERVTDAESDVPLRADVLALEDSSGRRRVLLAGLHDEPVQVTVEGIAGTATRAVIGDSSFGAPAQLRAVRGRVELELPATSVTILDLDRSAQAP
jgi:D-apionolactonase